MPEMRSIVRPDPHIFLTNHIRTGGNGTGDKIGASEAIYPKEIRVGEPNIHCCLRLFIY
jgi:hypothetical protein